MIKKSCKKGLYFWGYTDSPEDPNNETCYYTYGDSAEGHDRDDLAIYKGY
jgi:hypothetical protein